MPKRLRPELSFANVVSCLALFVALGSGAYAATHLPKNSVGSKQLKKNAVATAKIKNGAVTTGKIKAGAVTGVKVANGSLTGAQIDASTLGTVPAAELANSLPSPEAWHEVGQPGQPAFMNDWSNYGGQDSTAAFYKDAQSVVHLKGTLSGSKDATAAFFLPAGFRPSQILTLPTTGTQAAASISIFPVGEVRPYCGVSGCAPTLSGLSFRAES
jgi:hypothetical protein